MDQVREDDIYLFQVGYLVPSEALSMNNQERHQRI